MIQMRAFAGRCIVESVIGRANEHHMPEKMHERMRILFPETQDERVVEAVKTLKAHGFCEALTLSDFDDTVDVEILAQHYLEKRNLRGKGISIEEAREKMKDNLYRAATLVSMGYTDACIAGSVSSTGDVIRAGIQGVGVQEGIDTVSSFFIINHQGRELAFADCAVIEDPTAEQLADIAIATAENYKKITGNEPIVAMLSHSTLGSGKGPDVDKVTAATAMVQRRKPDLKIVGEIQFDAAFDEGVAEIKAKGNEHAGKANVFVFPNLAAGNISYKIAQRMAHATAIGPIVQGTAKPYLDLSRGCSVEDIVQLAELISKNFISAPTPSLSHGMMDQMLKRAA